MVSNVSGVPRFTVVSTQREGGEVRPVIVRSRGEEAQKARFSFRPPVPSVINDVSPRGRALSLASGSSNSVYDKSKLFEAISKAIVARGPPVGAPPAPIYALAASSASVNEGSSTNFVLTTANLASGSQVAYTLSGVSSADVQGGSLTGTATIGSDGRATITVGLLADNLTEGTETLSVAAGGASASTSVNDTSPFRFTTSNITNPATQFFWDPAAGGNGHIYEIVSTSVSWSQALVQATNASISGYQGYLVTVTSPEEQAFIDSIAGGSGSGFWFGATDATAEGDWRWVSEPGTSTLFWSNGPVQGQYNNWSTLNGSVEPNNGSGGQEHYLYYNYLGNRKWWDGRGTEGVSYIREYQTT